MTETKKKEALVGPSKAFEWTTVQVYEALSRPVPDAFVKTKSVKGTTIRFIEWHTAARILMKYAPGYTWEFEYKVHEFNQSKRGQESVSGELFVVGTLTIPCSDAVIRVQSSGIEDTDNPSIFGSAIQNAEANAFKRCAAKVGLGIGLYFKK